METKYLNNNNLFKIKILILSMMKIQNLMKTILYLMKIKAKAKKESFNQMVKSAKRKTPILKAIQLKTVKVHKKFVEFVMEEKQKFNNSRTHFQKINNVFLEEHKIIILIKI